MHNHGHEEKVEEEEGCEEVIRIPFDTCENPKWVPPKRLDESLAALLLAGLRSSTLRWKDVPRGTMDEVSSLGRLGLPSPDG